MSCGNVKDDQEKCNSTTWLFTTSRKPSAVTLFENGKMHANAKNKSPRLSVTVNCSLAINVIAEDVGDYTCRMFNKSGKQEGPGFINRLFPVNSGYFHHNTISSKRLSSTSYYCKNHSYSEDCRKFSLFFLFFFHQWANVKKATWWPWPALCQCMSNADTQSSGCMKINPLIIITKAWRRHSLPAQPVWHLQLLIMFTHQRIMIYSSAKWKMMMMTIWRYGKRWEFGICFDSFLFYFFNFKNIAVPVLLCTDDSLYKLMGSLGSSSQFAIQVISI